MLLEHDDRCLTDEEIIRLMDWLEALEIWSPCLGDN